MVIQKTMNAAVLTEYKKIQWQEMPVPQFGDDEVLVNVRYAGICGTDQHIFNGDFHPRTTTPMIQGHEFVGTIAEVGKNVKDYSEGDRVTVDPIIWCGKCAACQLGHYPACTSLKILGVDMNGGFGDYVASKESMLYKLPPEFSDKNAALIEVFSIGFHACNRAELGPGDTVAIWGAGRIGQCILQAARTRTDYTIFVIDILDNRLKIAKDNLSNMIAINPEKIDPISVIKEYTNGRGVDVAFEAVGHAASIPDRPHPVRCCIQSIRGAGTVCVLGLDEEPAPIVMKELIWKEAKIISSRVSHGEFNEAVHHMSLGNLNPEALISAEFPASEAHHAFELLENEPQNHLKILLKMP